MAKRDEQTGEQRDQQGAADQEHAEAGMYAGGAAGSGMPGDWSEQDYEEFRQWQAQRRMRGNGGRRDWGYSADQAMEGDLVPQIATAAIAAAGVAIVEAELLPAVLIGAGAALAPKLVPGLGMVMRPILKTVIRAGYGAMSTAQGMVAEAGEQMQDMVAEVRTERQGRAERRPRRTEATEEPAPGSV